MKFFIWRKNNVSLLGYLDFCIFVKSTNISNMFLAQCWRLKTSSRSFYDFIEMTIQLNLTTFNSWYLMTPRLLQVYQVILPYAAWKQLKKTVYQKSEPKWVKSKRKQANPFSKICFFRRASPSSEVMWSPLYCSSAHDLSRILKRHHILKSNNISLQI